MVFKMNLCEKVGQAERVKNHTWFERELVKMISKGKLSLLTQHTKGTNGFNTSRFVGCSSKQLWAFHCCELTFESGAPDVNALVTLSLQNQTQMIHQLPSCNCDDLPLHCALATQHRTTSGSHHGTIDKLGDKVAAWCVQNTGNMTTFSPLTKNCAYLWLSSVCIWSRCLEQNHHLKDQLLVLTELDCVDCVTFLLWSVIWLC